MYEIVSDNPNRHFTGAGGYCFTNGHLSVLACIWPAGRSMGVLLESRFFVIFAHVP